MKSRVILFAISALALAGCKKTDSTSGLEDERVKQIIMKENGLTAYTFTFTYDDNNDLYFYTIQAAGSGTTDSIYALKASNTFRSENLDGSYSYLPLFSSGYNGLVLIKNGLRHIGAGVDYYYYKTDTGAIHYNAGQQMIYYENQRSTDSTGCDPDRTYFDLGYTNENYTALSGTWGSSICGSSNHYWASPNLHFTYGQQPASLGFGNFGIRMFGGSNTVNTDSIYGTMHIDSDGFIYENFTDTINYKVNNTLDAYGRVVRTNFLPYDFMMSNVYYCGHTVYFTNVQSPYYPFKTDLEYEIEYY